MENRDILIVLFSIVVVGMGGYIYKMHSKACLKAFHESEGQKEDYIEKYENNFFDMDE